MSQLGHIVTGGGGGGVTSIAGTANQITASAAVGAVTLSVPATFIAPGSITATTTVTGVTLATSTAATNLQINGNTITASGSDANVDINLTSQGTSGIVFRGLTAGFLATKWHTEQRAVQTANATPTVIVSIPLANSEMVSISALINGFKSDFTNSLGGTIVVTAFRSAAGDITLVGAPIINVNYSNLVDTTDIDASIDVGTQSLRLLVIGVAAQTFNWVTTYNYMFTIDNT